ncbi:STAS domain-containing protein [Paenibacillus sp. MBLB4367]|uniref:STAS domain-containing protein n=1 Tax=Paenibacillus sp. MBLB4367 TaxID=3384767 RepID=UPI00390809DF
MEGSFEAGVRSAGSALIVDMKGDLTKQAEERLLGLHAWNEPLGEGGTSLILNFTGVPYINSAGIALLIRIVRSGAKAGRQTYAYGMNAHYQKLFRIVGLTTHMLIYPDEYAILTKLDIR